MTAIDPVAMPPAATMLPVEEGGARDPRPSRPGQDAAPPDLPVADHRVERRTGPGVARAVCRCRDFDYDARIGGTVDPLGQLDVPVLVVFELVDPPHPCGDAVGKKLALRSVSAAIPGSQVGGSPVGKDGRDGSHDRRDGGERAVRLLCPAVVRLPACLRVEWRAGREADESDRDQGSSGVRVWHRPGRAGAPGSRADPRLAPARGGDRRRRHRGPRRSGRRARP